MRTQIQKVFFSIIALLNNAEISLLSLVFSLIPICPFPSYPNLLVLIIDSPKVEIEYLKSSSFLNSTYGAQGISSF